MELFRSLRQPVILALICAALLLYAHIDSWQARAMMAAVAVVAYLVLLDFITPPPPQPASPETDQP